MTSLRAWFVCAAFLVGCSGSDDDTAAPTPLSAPDPAEETTMPIPGPEPEPSDLDAGSSMFIDVTDEVGLSFVYEARDALSYHLPGIMGGGAAVFDADGDGRPDIYFVNGDDGTPESVLTNRLFLQREDGTFEDATDGSGLGDPGYGQGCAVGDIDNDGDLDVYVSNFGPDRLFRNDGGGSFTDVSLAAGISNLVWGTSVAFLDYDRDGWLDIYIANYVEFSDVNECTDNSGKRDFCGPGVFPGVPDCLYRNRGDGTFVDVSESTGVSAFAFAGLGVVCADFNDDGWIDVYVANDEEPNLLWMNQRDGTFSEEAVMLGAAYDTHGRAEAGMGVTAGDADEDGDLDLYVSHFRAQTNTFYRNDGFAFEDDTAGVGLGAASMTYTGWGTVFFDADLDGDLDVAVANGAVTRVSGAFDEASFWQSYVERNLLFLNDGGGRFETTGDDAGAFTAHAAVSRGIVPVDIDADGDLDLLVTNIEGPARLYRNETNADDWLAIDVHDPRLDREALGARVTVRTGARTRVRHAIPPGGYLTGTTSTIRLGLAGETVVAIDVRWPDGLEESFPGEATGLIELRRGAGTAAP